jgi:hypothetical protein
MTFLEYWQNILEEELSRYQILDLRKAFFEIRRLKETKQLDKAVARYNELLKNAYETVQEYLHSGDIEVEDFVREVLPAILQYSRPREYSAPTVKKQEADPDLLQALRHVNNLFAMGKLNSVINFLSDIYTEDPASYADFIRFAKSYAMKSGKTFREKVFPRVLEIHPELGILKQD